MCKNANILGQGFRNNWKLAVVLLFAATLLNVARGAQTVTLAWNPNTEADLAGYNVYFGTASRVYTNRVNVGNTTSNSLSGLVSGVTYYFAVTAYNTAGAESDYSSEVSYLVPSGTNRPPTISVISNRTIPEDAGVQTVALSGISSGAANESQTLTVTASSSNPALIPNPTVSYISPASTGMVTFAAANNASGTATITVTVNDGQSINNITSQSFTVTVTPVNDPPMLSSFPNLTISQNSQSPAIPFTVQDLETPASTLAVIAASSNPALIPVSQIVFSGSSTNRTVTLTPALNQTGTSTITITAGDGVALASQTFVLTVTTSNNPPVITLPPSFSGKKNLYKWLQGLSVSDPDAGSANVSLHLTVQHGRLLVATNVPGGLASSQVAQNNSADVWIVASLAAINATMASSNGLLYLENANFIGGDSLTGTISDNGNTGSGVTLTQTAQSTITVLGDSLDNWRLQFFSQADLWDSTKEATVWGDKGDADADGRDNLLEFALGLNPVQKDSSKGVLDSGMVDIAGGKYATLTFVRRKNEPLLQYVPEVSSDGQTWMNGTSAMKELNVVSVDGTFEMVTCQDLTPIISASPRYFRLRVLKNDL